MYFYICTPNPSGSIPHPASFFNFFFNMYNPLTPICAIYIPMGGAIHQNVVFLLGITHAPLEKTSSSSLSIYQLFIVPQLVVGLSSETFMALCPGKGAETLSTCLPAVFNIEVVSLCPVPSLEAAVCSLHFQTVVWRNAQACPHHMPPAVIPSCQSEWQSWLFCLPSLLEKEVANSHASKVEKTGKIERNNKCRGPLNSSRDPSTGLPVIWLPLSRFLFLLQHTENLPGPHTGALCVQ